MFEAWLPRISHRFYCPAFFCVFFYASFVVFFFNMGGSVFFFIESKTFEVLVEEGGSYFLLRIFERGHTSMRSVFMGKESANQFLFHLE